MEHLLSMKMKELITIMKGCFSRIIFNYNEAKKISYGRTAFRKICRNGCQEKIRIVWINKDKPGMLADEKSTGTVNYAGQKLIIKQ